LASREALKDTSVPISFSVNGRNKQTRHFAWAAIAWPGLAVFILVLAIAGSGESWAVKLSDHLKEPSVKASRSAESPPQDSKGSKVAEGEYRLVEEGSGGAFGPPNEEIFNFHETWTLRRAENRGFELTGERRFESPQYTPHKERFWVRLSRDFALVSVKEFAKLRWRPDSGPLSCDFQPRNLHCNFGSKDSKQAFELDVPVKDPCGFLWPVAPFSFSSVAHAAEKDRDIPTPVQLISMEQPDAQNPVRPKVMDGEIRYLGREEITAAQQKWKADKFELHVATHPKLLMWLSREGILLVLSPEHTNKNWPKEQLELVRFQKYQDF
jgi:hypothetical protein